MSYRRIIYLTIISVLISLSAFAQDRKLVTGRIVDVATDKPIDLSQIEVVVYSYNTVAEARDAVETIKNDPNAIILPEERAYPDEHGFYQIHVASTGALIFKADMQDPVLEEVNGRLEINERLNIGNRIRNSLISVTRESIGVMDQQTDIDGNYLKVRSTINIPPFEGQKNARLIVQPYLVDGVTKDTVRYLKPIVLDGKEYVLTQLRRKNYNALLDTLTYYRLDDKNLSAREILIPWADTVFLSHPDRPYQVKGIIQMEDYNIVYYNKDYYLGSSRIRRPMRFLECPVGPYYLDPDEYTEYPKRERRNTVGKMSLNFMIGKARLDDKDTAGFRQISALRETLLDIANAQDAVLKEFHIVGVASPDGPYDSNLRLAQRRMQYALEQIASVLPENIRERVYMTTTAHVAPWTAVSELMRKDAHIAEADAIDVIVKENPGSYDRQWYMIRKLPFYRPLIVSYLPQLRSVQYTHTQEVFRALTPAEILDRYNNDPDFRSGRKQFTLYEYWHLFRMVKDRDDLEILAKRAYDESLRDNGKPWILAANYLAACYIDKGITDTTILSPFIDMKTHVANVKVRYAGTDRYVTVNPEAVVANQLIMYVRIYDFQKASQLCQMLGDAGNNKQLKAFAMCLGGYYKGGNTPQQKDFARSNFEMAEQSSPLNKVVMNLALDTKHNDDLASEAMADLPDSALKDYLWAVIYGRRAARSQDVMDDMSSTDYLLSSFHKDKSFIDLAAEDGDIQEDIYKEAKARYDEGE